MGRLGMSREWVSQRVSSAMFLCFGASGDVGLWWGSLSVCVESIECLDSRF